MPDRVAIPGQSTVVGCPFFISKKLTGRERQTLSLAARGLTDVEISQVLFVVPRTVRAHLQKAREKLGANNTTHAVAIALAGQLIQFE
ncbi:MAG: helix-turn-helix transcriptional regulator [Anaerolineae bacterium]|nr:helix-turn-helix transcriptional regulator [Anaerolineae bacterium]